MKDEFSCYNLPRESVDWTQLEPTFKFQNSPLKEISSNRVHQNYQRKIGNEDDYKDVYKNTSRRWVNIVFSSEFSNFSSAYAIFFREQQSLTKKENPDVSFGKLSRIIARKWDGLPSNLKQVNFTNPTSHSLNKNLGLQRPKWTQKASQYR